MATPAYSVIRRTKQKNARTKTLELLTKLNQPSIVTAQPKMKGPTDGDGQPRWHSVGAKRATPAGVERQAIKHDQHKPDYSLLTRAMLEPMTRALMYGEGKYSRGNFRAGFENIRLTSAALRHIFAYLDREEFDAESNISHLGHAMAALAMLLDNISEGVSTDVRYQKEGASAAPPRFETLGRRDIANLSHPTDARHTQGVVSGGDIRKRGKGRTAGRGTAGKLSGKDKGTNRKGGTRK